MEFTVTKVQALRIFEQIRANWRHDGFLSPFFVEYLYADFFFYLLKALPVPDSHNVAKNVCRFINSQLESSILAICKLLDRNTPDGTLIWNLMDSQAFILRKHQISYNRQVAGKGPKGITAEYWIDYNNWLLAGVYWDGFIESQKSGYVTRLPAGMDLDALDLSKEEIPVLCAMRNMYIRKGSPLLSYRNFSDSINVSPLTSWMRWKIRQK
jgi:hypothetical protein